ncbi:MAG: hypothetical protein XD43_0980 [Thermococcales archaeon 44_46]|nr:MAG: hypothetical protein XD43_0980 [Thermococcales archaeon 44_46]
MIIVDTSVFIDTSDGLLQPSEREAKQWWSK